MNHMSKLSVRAHDADALGGVEVSGRSAEVAGKIDGSP